MLTSYAIALPSLWEQVAWAASAAVLENADASHRLWRRMRGCLHYSLPNQPLTQAQLRRTFLAAPLPQGRALTDWLRRNGGVGKPARYDGLKEHYLDFNQFPARVECGFWPVFFQERSA